jgi:hypothetical protein
MKGNLLSHEPKLRIKLTRFASLLFMVFCSLSLNAQPKTALSFDGNDDRVDLPNILTASYTKEAWIYAPLDNPFPGSPNNNIVSGSGTAFWFPGSQGFRLTAGHFNTGNSFIDVQDPNPIEANKWYHVAVTYDAATTTLTLYKNGVQVASNATVPNQVESELHIGSYQTQAFMKGFIDEVRIWSVALSQSEIRDWMCKKVIASHPQYANLLAYYKADDGLGTNLDDSKNTSDGTLVNGTAWVTSGAALGDESAHDYVNAIGKNASLSVVATSETFTATNTGGAPDGIQVYRVDAVPDNVTGLSGIGSNNKYFGVFQVGGTNPTYDAAYNYGTSYGGVETSYRLFKRPDNAAASWTDALATQDVNTNTLTASAVSGQSSEFMLGSIGNPLPVSFTKFVTSKERNGVKLMWSTAQEINNTGFIVQRSADGKNWTDLGFVPASGNSSVQNTYNFADGNPARGLNLYRLKQIDINGDYKLSEIRIINYLNNAGITVYPTPASNEIFVDLGKRALLNTRMKLFDVQGREIERFTLTQLQQRISVAGLKNGIYVLQFADGTISKFVKQ